MFLTRGGKKIAVQCKAYAKKVGPNVVRDLYGTMRHFEVQEGWVVSTRGFSAKAHEFAWGKSIELVTISDLLKGAAALELRSG